jgi:wobble nucleotide-excising tRNase
MIRRIDSLKDFGLFRDFDGSDSSDVRPFKKYNLLYGWNYSGKTTLSRVFQSLEKLSIPSDYSTASFRIVLDDGTTLNSTDLSFSPIVKVFNRDFVDSNFRQEHTAPAVFILGDESAALRARLVQLQGRQAKVKEICEGLKNTGTTVEEDINKLGTDRARDVGNLLGDRNFRRPILERRIGEVKGNPTSYILNDDTVEAKLATIRSGGDLAELSEIRTSVPDFVEIARQVNLLLSQTASNLAIERLRNNPDIEAWVRTGLGLHKDSSTCEYCGSPLTDVRMEELRGHFSKAYESLIGALEAEVRGLESPPFDFVIPDKTRLIPDARSGFVEAVEKYKGWKTWATQTREQLIEALKQKLTAIEDQTEWVGNLARAAQVAKTLKPSMLPSESTMKSSLAWNRPRLKLKRPWRGTTQHFTSQRMKSRKRKA